MNSAQTQPDSGFRPSSFVLRLSPFLALLGSLLLLPRLIIFAQTSLSLLTWSWQFDYTEGINLNDTIQLAAGRNIYRHNGPEGFLSAPYPPIFYILNAPLSWLVGPQLWPGRAISLLATLAIAGLIGYIVWKTKDEGYVGSPRWFVVRPSSALPSGIMAGALWLSLSPVMVWAAMYKQDMVALAFGLGGVAWALTYTQGRRLYVAAVFFALAFYTKQSPITAAAATTLWLLLRDFRSGLRFMGVLAALILVPFGVGNLLLRGGLWEHLIGNHALPWNADGFWKALRRLQAEYLPLIVWGVGGLAGAVIGFFTRQEGLRSKLASPWTLVALYALIAWTFTLVQTGYEGANYNHLLDGLLSLCLLAGFSMRGVLRRLSAQRVEAIAGAALMAVLLVAQVVLFKHPHTWYSGAWPSPERDADMRSLSRLVAITPGYIHSEDGHLLLSNGHTVLYEDGSTFGPLGKLDRWDDSTLTRMFQERRFALVLLQHGSKRLTPNSLAAFSENYTLKYRSDIDTYEPKPHATPQGGLSCTLSGDGDAVSLRGYTLSPSVEQTGIRPGQELRVTLYWQTASKLQHSYASYVHMVSEGGERVAGQDNPNTGAPQPATAWEPGTLVADAALLPLPDNVPPGRYRLITGMYRVEGGGIKGISSACEKGEVYGDSVSLGWIEVRPR